MSTQYLGLDLIWKYGLCRCNHLSWDAGTLSKKVTFLIRTKKEGHMMTEAETGWTNMPAATRSWKRPEGSFSGACRGSPGLLAPQFQTPGLQNAERARFCWFVVFRYGSRRTLTHLGPDCHHPQAPLSPGDTGFRPLVAPVRSPDGEQADILCPT